MIWLNNSLGSDFISVDGLPFNGGAIGYFSYDLARRLETLPVIAEDAEHIAEMAVGIYQWAVIVDHQQQQSYLVGHDREEQQWHDFNSTVQPLTRTARA